MTPTAPPLANAVLLPRASIRPNPDQARQFFDEGEIENLRSSLAEHGMLQPIVVRHEPSRYDGTPFVIVGGERRWRASEGVLEKVPAIIQDVSPAKARELSLVENLQRRDLTAHEEAIVVREMMESEGLSVKEVAARLHKSPGWVNNRLSYLKTGADVRAVGERVTKSMSSLLLVDKVKAPVIRAGLLEAIERDEIRHAEVKTRVDSILEAEKSAARAAEFVRRSQTAPDTQTQSRGAAVSRGETGAMSRGLRVTGPSKAEANNEAMRALGNLERWGPLCDDKTYEKIVELARRFVRGDLKR